MFYIKRAAIAILLLLHITILFANKPYVVNIYSKSYNADNKNWAIGEDERGILYFGNDGGLLQYDGIEWTLYKMNKAPILRSLAVKSHNTIFTGGYEEFGRWDRDISGELIYTSLSDSIDKSSFRNDDFWKIWIDTSVVYFQSFNTIYVYDYKNITSITSENGFLFLSKVRDEYYVQQMQGPLFRLKGSKLEKIEGSDFLEKTDVRVILPYGRDKIIIGTARQGLYIYDGKTFSTWNPVLTSELNAKDLNCGILTSSGTYMLGTILGGVYEVDTKGNILNRLSADNTLQNNTILSLFEDSRKNVWVAMDRGLANIHYINDIDCYTDIYGKTPTVYDAQIWKDKLFLATNQGVFYLNTTDLSQPSTLDKLKFVEGTQGQVWKLNKLGEELYCCHNRGLLKINPNLTIQSAFSVDIGLYDMNNINIYNLKSIILPTYYSVRILHPDTRKIYISSKIKEPILTAMDDHLDNLWLEHFNKGVYRCRLNKDLTEIESYKYYGGDSGDGLPYKLKIFKIGGRIMLYGNNSFYTYDDIHDSIVSSTILNECFKSIKGIKNIISGADHEFWALGKNAVYRFKFDGYNAEILDNFTFEGNLYLVNNSENASNINSNQTLICLDNGFLIYTKSDSTAGFTQKIKLKTPFLSAVESSNIKGEKLFLEISANAKIKNSFKHLITFSFSSPDAFSPNITFQYKLQGIDIDWLEKENINKISYARLPTGKYTLFLRTKNNIGNFSEQIEYKFEILPPWHATIWAFFAYVIIFMLTFYFIWSLILRRYRNLHLQKIRARETKRLRSLASELQDKLELKSAELLTQTSFIIQKNELIMKVKDIVDVFRPTATNKDVLQIIKKIDSLIDTVDHEADWKSFMIAFEEKHNDFFKKLKTEYPELTANDLRLCACLRLNLESKEIASLMNLSVRAVENSRYRLRKKMNLSPNQNLNEIIINF